ncbi:Flagellar hook-associated protein FlgK [hydrothermal vent metagenome]|uniref:Flagellar hook-associated protein FlgK n=1 Tax=hydrothermal vent metagenome TaxID=652676 RepID=A0A3B1AX00_9ZZZZ
MAGDVLGISVSGLLASQRNLSTTSHNIANANTEGYSRQRVEVVARTPQARANGAVGTGVVVSHVGRVYDQFVAGEVRDNTSSSTAFRVNHDYTSQVDNLLSDPNAGLAPSLQSFFAAVNSVSDDPSSTSARQVLVSEAHSLGDRFNYIDDRFSTIRKGVNRDVHNIVGEISEIADSIAKLNDTVVRAREIGGGSPSDLLDQRDRLVVKLSALVSVRVAEQEDGRLNVFMGNGQALVIGSIASELEAQNSRNDPDEIEIIFRSGNGSESVVTRFLTGGKLGGLMDFRKGILDSSQNEMGRIAVGIAKTFNDQHRLGMDLNNDLGENFFFESDEHTPKVLPVSRNEGDTLLGAEITDINKLTISDYQLTFRGGEYKLVRMKDDQLIGTYSSLPAEAESEGIKINKISGSSLVDGDSFIIRPTRLGGQNFSTIIADVSKIAAASPLRTEANIGNLGNGKISAAVVHDTENHIFDREKSKLTPPFVIRFVDESHFEVLDNTGNAIPIKLAAVPDDTRIQSDAEGHPVTVAEKEQANPPGVSTVLEYDRKKGTDIFPLPDGTDFGFRVHLTGEPKGGDTFRVEFNTDGIGDNRNAVSLAKLQNTPTLANNTTDYSQAYSQLVSRVGSKTHELEINADAQSKLLTQAKERNESISGVNLDEEAANMLRFQSLYQANAQVIATANKLLDTLLNSFR